MAEKGGGWLKKLGGAALGVVKNLAPMAATAIGGPFGGVAATALKAVLGTEDESEVERLLAEGDPATLVKLKELDNDFAVRMEELGYKREELAVRLAESQEQQRTERHQTDMQSDSWLSKNIRPLSLIVFTVVYLGMVIADSIETVLFEVPEAHNTTIRILLVSIYSFYFVSREVGKAIVNVKNGKAAG